MQKWVTKIKLIQMDMTFKGKIVLRREDTIVLRTSVNDYFATIYLHKFEYTICLPFWKQM